MFLFISGGVRSGKSEWAERAALALSPDVPRVYLATARVSDEDMRRRVERHRRARSGRGFLTVERERDLTGVLHSIPRGALVLLECLPNWAANEMFLEDGSVRGVDEVRGEILRSTLALKDRVRDLIVVSDDIFSDGGRYDAAVEGYVRLLGELHVLLAARADAAVECAFGIARFWKGDASRIFDGYGMKPAPDEHNPR